MKLSSFDVWKLIFCKIFIINNILCFIVINFYFMIIVVLCCLLVVLFVTRRVVYNTAQHVVRVSKANTHWACQSLRKLNLAGVNKRPNTQILFPQKRESVYVIFLHTTQHSTAHTAIHFLLLRSCSRRRSSSSGSSRLTLICFLWF